MITFKYIIQHLNQCVLVFNSVSYEILVVFVLKMFNNNKNNNI